MALSAIARFARLFRRWCMARPVGAALMALALGGIIAGGAMALSPTVDTALVFRGGVNIINYSVDPVTTQLAYTVPAGRKFMLTDLVIANSSETAVANLQQVTTGTTGCTVTTLRTSLTLPAGGTLHLPFVTGFGFTAGQNVCIRNGDGTVNTYWTIRGFLFE